MDRGAPPARQLCCIGLDHLEAGPNLVYGFFSRIHVSHKSLCFTVVGRVGHSYRHAPRTSGPWAPLARACAIGVRASRAERERGSSRSSRQQPPAGRWLP